MGRLRYWRVTGSGMMALVVSASLLGTTERPSEAAVAHKEVAKRFNQLVFKDNFRTLDPRRWTVTDTGQHWVMPGGNCLRRDMVTVRNRRLRIKSRYLPEPVTCTTPAGTTSKVHQLAGSLTTKGNFDQERGKWSVRAKFPRHDGHHSAIWLMPRDQTKLLNPLDGRTWPASGEVDLVERFPHNGRTAFQSVHYLDTSEGTSYSARDGDGNPGASNGCHVGRMDRFHWYTMVWKKRVMKFYVDKELCWRHRWDSPLGGPRAPFNQPFHLILTQLAPDHSGTQSADQRSTRVTVVDKVRIKVRND